jgi:DNA-binding NtrC family response regulator
VNERSEDLGRTGAARLPLALGAQSEAASLGSYLEDCERSYISCAFAANGGRIGQSAATLGISRKNLWGG